MKYLFRVKNRHSSPVPEFDGDQEGRYYGYFQNEFGEQFIFIYEYEKHEGVLWMGDMDWDQPHPVVGGVVEDIVLGVNEQAWLKVCWYTALSQDKPQ